MDKANSNKQKDNTDKYNIIMPETSDRVLCVRIEKPISPEGYAENFAPRIRAMIERHGGIRLLIHYKEYKGWEAEAALMDMAGVAEFGAKVVRFAMVNPPKKDMLRYSVKRPLIAGETRVFTTEELGEALAWVAT